MLDNADGKQARKTGSSSVLGMLFDHGCDMITTFAFIAMTINVTRGYKKRNGFEFAMATYIIFQGAFLCLMEGYFTGGLQLPAYNAPTEGLILIACLPMVTYFFGKCFGTGFTCREQVLECGAAAWVRV